MNLLLIKFKAFSLPFADQLLTTNKERKCTYFSMEAGGFILKFNSLLVYSKMNLIVDQENYFYKGYFMGRKYRKK